MTDRELLELAANAAGKSLRAYDWHEAGFFLAAGDASHFWNPLTDDGDALRLAVKLGLDVFSRPGQWAECGRIGAAGAREPYNGDPCAATRRAIVRAAAAIGKSMETQAEKNARFRRALDEMPTAAPLMEGKK